MIGLASTIGDLRNVGGTCKSLQDFPLPHLTITTLGRLTGTSAFQTLQIYCDYLSPNTPNILADHGIRFCYTISNRTQQLIFPVLASIAYIHIFCI